MRKTEVWENDTHKISWRVTSEDGVVDLSTASAVRLVAKPAQGGDAMDLENTAVGDVVTHQLDGTLAPGRYQLVVEATRNGEITTYPDAEHGALDLVVKTDIG